MSLKPTRKTDVTHVVDELNGGVVKLKLSDYLSAAALATIDETITNKTKAKVTIEFAFEKFGDQDQVKISHKIGMLKPTKRGKVMEEDTTDTLMFVGIGGQLTIDAPDEAIGGQLPIEQTRSQKIADISKIK